MEVRAGFEQRDSWSFAECAQWAGCSWRTVRKWMYDGKFRRGHALGSYPVDAQSFQEYVKTGVPQ